MSQTTKFYIKTGFSRSEQLTEQVQRLAAAERSLETLTAGQLDAIVDPAGNSFLLRPAQIKLLEREAEQRRMVELQQAILNTLPAQIGLIDEHGTILFLNDSCRQFEGTPLLPSSELAIGRNYFALCELAYADGNDDARKASDGIRQVVQGETRQFSLEYPSHSSAEQTWHRLSATALTDSEIQGAVLMHTQLTNLMVDEEALGALIYPL